MLVVNPILHNDNFDFLNQTTFLVRQMDMIVSVVQKCPADVAMEMVCFLVGHSCFMV